MDSIFNADIDRVCELTEQGYYDFIVVGSGLGGGTLTRAEGPTQDNDLVYSMVKQTVATAPGSDVYAGGPVYCLGGRSTVWGLYAPRIFKEKHEKHFPPNISDYLEQGGYEKALELLTNGSQTFTTIYPSNEINANETTYAEGHLNEAIKKFYQSIGKHSKPKVELSALASQFRSEKVYNFPQGAYSTVDYLLDRTYQRDPNLTILLNTEVLTVSKAADTGKLGLKIRSSSNDKTYQVSAKTIILSAGTIGTARIALSSGLQRHIPLVGKGLTDHDIWGVRFHMKLDKKLNDPLKLQCRLLVGGEDVLLNVAINANSFLAREFTGSHYFDEGGNLHHGPPPAGEEYDTVNITIETQALLVDSNEVVDIPSREPVIRMKRRARDSNTAKQEKMQDQMQDLATLIGKALGLGPVAKAPRLTRAGLGAVAHEVGTMRMEGRHDKDFVVDKNLQVRGYDGLYVCDLSIFPFSPPANPSLTLAAIALQLADRLTEMK